MKLQVFHNFFICFELVGIVSIDMTSWERFRLHNVISVVVIEIVATTETISPMNPSHIQMTFRSVERIIGVLLDLHFFHTVSFNDFPESLGRSTFGDEGLKMKSGDVCVLETAESLQMKLGNVLEIIDFFHINLEGNPKGLHEAFKGKAFGEKL